MSKKRSLHQYEFWFQKASLYQNMLDSGKVKNLGELAQMEKVSKARIYQIMSLNNLAPEIKNWLLTIVVHKTMKQAKKKGFNEKTLRKIAQNPNYQQQKQKFRKMFNEIDYSISYN